MCGLLGVCVLYCWYICCARMIVSLFPKRNELENWIVIRYDGRPHLLLFFFKLFFPLILFISFFFLIDKLKSSLVVKLLSTNNQHNFYFFFIFSSLIHFAFIILSFFKLLVSRFLNKAMIDKSVYIFLLCLFLFWLLYLFILKFKLFFFVLWVVLSSSIEAQLGGRDKRAKI